MLKHDLAVNRIVLIDHDSGMPVAHEPRTLYVQTRRQLKALSDAWKTGKCINYLLARLRRALYPPRLVVIVGHARRRPKLISTSICLPIRAATIAHRLVARQTRAAGSGEARAWQR
jgi:hypothetical protein